MGKYKGPAGEGGSQGISSGDKFHSRQPKGMMGNLASERKRTMIAQYANKEVHVNLTVSVQKKHQSTCVFLTSCQSC